MTRTSRPSPSRIRFPASVGALLVVLAAVATPAAAPAPQADALLAGLQRWLDGTRDLQAVFEQSLESGALGSGLSESGRMYLARPGRMRWDYLDPESKVALIEGQRMSLYLEEDAQFFRTRIGEGEGDLLPRLLAGTGRLEALFEASIVTAEAGGRTGLRLVPRDRAETFEEVVLELRLPDHAIRGATVLDAAGNRMLYRFSDLRRNEGLPVGIFDFTPPPGTDIVEQP